MRAPFHKAAAPRIRALAPLRPRGPSLAAPPSGGVFRDFVATLERLEKSTRRKGRSEGGAESRSASIAYAKRA